MPDKDYQSKRDKLVKEKVMAVNRLEDYSYTPKNVVLVTVEDIVEIFHEMIPYTMSKLDSISEERQKAADERESKLLDSIEEELLMYTAKHDLPMRDEALRIIASKRQQPSKDKGGTK